MPRSIKKQFPDIFIDWHPKLNGKVNPSTVRRTSKKKYYWKCHNKKCGCVWKSTIYARLNLGDKCPRCIERKKKKSQPELSEIKSVFAEINKIKQEIDNHMDVFLNDDMSMAKKIKSSILVRRKITEIGKHGKALRKIVIEFKKRFFNLKKQKKSKKL